MCAPLTARNLPHASRVYLRELNSHRRGGQPSREVYLGVRARKDFALLIALRSFAAENVW